MAGVGRGCVEEPLEGVAGGTVDALHIERIAPPHVAGVGDGVEHLRGIGRAEGVDARVARGGDKPLLSLKRAEHRRELVAHRVGGALIGADGEALVDDPHHERLVGFERSAVADCLREAEHEVAAHPLRVGRGAAEDRAVVFVNAEEVARALHIVRFELLVARAQLGEEGLGVAHERAGIDDLLVADEAIGPDDALHDPQTVLEEAEAHDGADGAAALSHRGAEGSRELRAEPALGLFVGEEIFDVGADGVDALGHEGAVHAGDEGQGHQTRASIGATRKWKALLR